MKLVVPVNWQSSDIPLLAERRVKYVYGKRHGDFVGSSSVLPPPFARVSDDGMAAYIKGLHRQGMTLTYVIDSMCLDNQEWTTAGQKSLRCFLDKLVSCGVDSFSVSMPYLVELIKKKYPKTGIEISSVAGVDGIQRARRWEDMGVSVITLDPTKVNRDVGLLRAIRSYVACELQLVVNGGCRDYCIEQSLCANILSHSSQGGCQCGLESRGSHCLGECVGAEIGSSLLISPEDVCHYEALGINRFQLSGVNKEGEILWRVMDAYSL